MSISLDFKAGIRWQAMQASEIENILFDQKVLRGWSIKMKRVSENFPLTAHLNTLSVPLDTHFSKLKISK